MSNESLSEEFLKKCDFTLDSQYLVRELLSRIGDKWSISAIVVLAEGTRRFTELQQAIPGISHRMLTVVLRSLENDGLVHREDFGGMPRRVEYRLTPLGTSFLGPMLGLMTWADDHHGEIEASRASTEAEAGNEATKAAFPAGWATTGQLTPKPMLDEMP